MREYARISPRFWMGQTGRSIREKGANAQLLALYLLTSPHSNMIGLYWCPAAYMSHETGLSSDGALKALRSLVEIGFCEYDEASEVVWVVEMAKYQVGERLSEKDKQAKGVQNTYDDLPKNPYLQPFFERYGEAFCMSQARTFEGPSRGLGSKETEQEKEKAREKEKELCGGFDAFWEAWPKHHRKGDRDKCLAKWKADKLHANADEVVANVEAWKLSTQWKKDGGQFIPAPLVYLRQQTYLNEAPPKASPDLFVGGKHSGFDKIDYSEGIEEDGSFV
jgi:hypothetical protein